MGNTSNIHATADYIHDLSTQLAKLATDARLDLLAYLLEMAQLEARLVRDRTAKGDTPVPVLATQSSR